MTAHKLLPHYSVSDWEQWEGKWELIEGIPFAMSPSPTPLHQKISSNIYGLFEAALKECRKCVVLQACDWEVRDDTILVPDVLVVCGEDWKKLKRFRKAPEIVVEILSPSTERKDVEAKAEIYRENRVKLYLIADPKTAEIAVLENREGEWHESYRGKGAKQYFDLGDCRFEADLSEAWKSVLE